MKVVVGLGNPGKKYLFTPHNIGWMVLDALSAHFDGKFQKREGYDFQKLRLKEIPETLILIKPTTFMNRSGIAVKKVLSYFKLQVQDLLVIHDELDFSFLTMKFHKNKSDAGHNGVKDITSHLQTKDYVRLRIGVKPLKAKDSLLPDGKKKTTLSSSRSQVKDLSWRVDPYKLESMSCPPLVKSSFDVLKSFNKEEQKMLPQFLGFASQAVKDYFKEGLNKTSSFYNSQTLADYLKKNNP